MISAAARRAVSARPPGIVPVSSTPFSRACVPALLAALLAGVAAAVLLVTLAAVGRLEPLTGPIHDGGWTNRSRGWFTSRGIYETEFSDGATGRYNWTGPSLRIQIANISRTQAHRLILQIEGARPAGESRPTLSWTVDGVAPGTHQMTSDAESVSIVIPARDSTRAVVTAQITPTFHAGPNDDRVLGVVIREIGLTPDGGSLRPTWNVVARFALAAAFAVAGVLLCGVPGVLRIPSAAAIVLAFTWLIVQDGAFLGTFADGLLHLGAAAAGIGMIVLALRLARPTISSAPDWATAVGLVLAASVVKIAFFSHPLATLGDGIFQVHRSMLVQGGNYLFTSITPRPFFEFPYAVGLFVAAKPFWSWFQTDVDHVWLLRTIALVADALVGVALYAAAWRVWQQKTTALLIAGLWPFARAPLEALCNANLPNVFGQGLFGVAIAGLVWSVASKRPAIVVLAATTVVLAASFLSHFSTFSVGVPIVIVAALSLVGTGGADGRRRALWVVGTAVLAVAIAWAVYYRHFGEVYQATFERVMSHEVVDEPGSAIAATPAIKFQRWLSGTSDDYGLPGLPLGLAAAFGLVLLTTERRRDPLTLVLIGWLVAWIGFTAIGILTAVQMRANLAAAPVFVCLGAYGLSGISRRGMTGAALAVVVVLAIVVNGSRLWFMCLGH